MHVLISQLWGMCYIHDDVSTLYIEICKQYLTRYCHWSNLNEFYTLMSYKFNTNLSNLTNFIYFAFKERHT